MTSQFIDDFVSIYSLPELDAHHIADAGAQITLGDLHANAMKLIYLLVRHGVITNINSDLYNELAYIYRSDVNDITADDLQRFNNILDELTFNKKALIRLLGDEMCDRGSNDYFTLSILSKLHQHQVPFEIILSNHSGQFIEAYETKPTFSASILEPRHSISMDNLETLIDRHLMTRAEIHTMIREAYQPHLKAVSYSLNDTDSSITIYSHAPIDLLTVRAMTRRLDIAYQDTTARELAATIEAINRAYQSHVQHNTVHSLLDTEVLECAYRVIPFSGIMHPFEYTTWNRDLRFLEQPEVHNRYQLFFAHGHDSTVSDNKNIFNLDNLLGKTMNAGTGQYTALYSHEHALTLIARHSGREITPQLRTSMQLFERTSVKKSNDPELPTEAVRKTLSH